MNREGRSYRKFTYHTRFVNDVSVQLVNVEVISNITLQLTLSCIKFTIFTRVHCGKQYLFFLIYTVVTVLNCTVFSGDMGKFQHFSISFGFVVLLVFTVGLYVPFFCHKARGECQERTLFFSQRTCRRMQGAYIIVVN